MTRPDRLGAVRLLYYEPLASLGSAMTAQLAGEGMKRVQHIHTLERLEGALRTEDPHALLLEMDVHGDDLIQLVRRIRRGRAGLDPFVATIACKSQVTSDLARTYAAAGFDHVLNKPHSADTVTAHLKDLAAKPRRFIAAKGYVGPDRRRGPRDANQCGVMDVPNRIAAVLDGAPVETEGYAARITAWRTMLSDISVV
ncbi:MAG: hypothetical protein RIB45_00775 [Marivibrio sp.]|uniref:hypothetical protein n=1 Tax=Marivibrio sp. TaxID=2039719 RepID=UPI0032F076DB